MGRFWLGGLLLMTLFLASSFAGAGLVRAGGADGLAWALGGFAGPLALGAAVGGWGLAMLLVGSARALAARDLSELERVGQRHRTGRTCLGVAALLVPAIGVGALLGLVVGVLSPLSLGEGALRLGGLGAVVGAGLVGLARADLLDLRGGGPVG